MNRWHVYEYIKQRYMHTGKIPDHHELASMFIGIDPDELVEGIYEFHSFVPYAGDYNG